MKITDIITESRGVAARQTGETYVSNTNPEDILTIQNIDVMPDNDNAYDSLDDLRAALEVAIPTTGTRIDDNQANAGTKAAIVATVTDADNNVQYWVRYIKEVPASGVMGLWKTLNGYKYSVGAKTESLPVKPSDLITDENYRSSSELAMELMQNVSTQMEGSGHEEYIRIMSNAIEQARTGSKEHIAGAHEYSSVLAKYSGEYLGPLALIDAPDSVGGNTAEMMQHFGISNLEGAEVMFPQDTAMELIDSVIRTADGIEIQISSKIAKSGGAASSLSGIWKQMPDSAKKRFPRGAKVIETLATASSVTGPIKVAQMYDVISNEDVQELVALDKSSRTLDDIKSKRIKELIHHQGVQDGTMERPEYRVIYHALAAIANAIVPVVSNDAEFKSAMLAALNNNQYVQVLTHTSKRGEDLALSYSTKFPAVFEGTPQLYNKTYFATGQKGRIGFKLK